MNHIQDRVERHKREGRPTIVVNDEAHLITIHPLPASYSGSSSRAEREVPQANFAAWFREGAQIPEELTAFREYLARL